MGRVAHLILAGCAGGAQVKIVVGQIGTLRLALLPQQSAVLIERVVEAGFEHVLGSDRKPSNSARMSAVNPAKSCSASLSSSLAWASSLISYSPGALVVPRSKLSLVRSGRCVSRCCRSSLRY